MLCALLAALACAEKLACLYIRFPYPLSRALTKGVMNSPAESPVCKPRCKSLFAVVRWYGYVTTTVGLLVFLRAIFDAVAMTFWILSTFLMCLVSCLGLEKVGEESSWSP